MDDKDIKKIAKVFKILLDNRLEDFEEKVRKIVRSEVEYFMEKNGGDVTQMNDSIPEEKLTEIKSQKKSKEYKSPQDMMQKMRKMNEERLNPDKDIYVDDNDNQIDLSENKKVDDLKSRDYSFLVE